MRKIFTTSMLTALMLATGVTTAQATDYITAPVALTDAGRTVLRNGQIIESLGTLDIFFENTQIQGSKKYDDNPANVTYIPVEEYLSIKIDGQEIVNSTNWTNRSPSYSSFWYATLEESNEQNGKNEVTEVGVLRVTFPDNMWFPFGGPALWPDGKMGVITIKEGAITSTEGDINPEIRIVLYKMGLYVYGGNENDVLWTPEGVTKFDYGTCKLSMTWPKVESLEINHDALILPFIQRETSDNNGDQNPCLDLMSVSEDGTAIEFDFTSLPGGNYILDVPSCSVFINGNYVNWEATYNFTINPAPEPVLPMVSYDPSNNVSYENLSNVNVWWMSAPLTLNPDNTDKMTISFNDQVLAIEPAVTLGFMNDVKVEGIDGNMLGIDLSNVEWETGEYTITIPAGYLLVSDLDGNGELPNEEVNITYVIELSLTAEPAVSPIKANWSLAEGSDIYPDSDPVSVNWGNVTLEVVDGKTIVANNETENSSVNLTLGKEVSLSDDNSSLLLSLGALPSGVYAIEIPEGYVTMEDGLLINGETVMNYNIIGNPSIDDGPSGIESLENNDGEVVIYNLQGVRVNHVAKGIYIINGKKVLVK